MKDSDGYLVLLCLTERGEVALLYPNGEAKDHHLQAGKTIQIPSSDAKWEIQIHPPRGKEWLVAYFFEKNPLQGYDISLYTLAGLPGNRQGRRAKLYPPTLKYAHPAADNQDKNFGFRLSFVPRNIRNSHKKNQDSDFDFDNREKML